MSRSNPTEHGIANPSQRWFEWDGANGVVRYYDKTEKKNIDVGSAFTFVLLDELGRVGGWHDPSGSSIFSNEVKDTRRDPFVVKAFKHKGVLVEGLYASIKDRVHSLGGEFVANCYIAFKHDSRLAIGSLRFKGSSLKAWTDFRAAHRDEIYKSAVQIDGYTEGKKGKIVFRVPVLKIQTLSPESDAQAVVLDRELQTFLKSYFARSTQDQVATRVADDNGDQRQPGDEEPVYQHDEPPPPSDDDDIPF